MIKWFKNDVELLKRFGLTRRSVAAILGVCYTSVRTQNKLTVKFYLDLEKIILTADNHFKDKTRTTMWLRIQNPLLNNLSPIQIIRAGQIHTIVKLCKTM